MEQTACAPGFYQPESGQASCLAAPPGTFVDTEAAVAASPWPPGTYQPLAGQVSCFLAPPGTYVAVSGAAAATPCPAGYYQPAEGQIRCLAADPGSYVPFAGAIAQIACLPGYTSEAAATECVLLNHLPIADAGWPYVVAVGPEITLGSSASTDHDGDALTVTWSATDGTISGNIYMAGNTAGIFTTAVTVADPGALEDIASSMIVVYDPDGGFVTGGGWIWSEAGWCQLEAVCAGDGSPDTFRIRIWWEDASDVEHDMYDNGFEQAVGGANIVVHEGK